MLGSSVLGVPGFHFALHWVCVLALVDMRSEAVQRPELVKLFHPMNYPPAFIASLALELKLRIVPPCSSVLAKIWPLGIVLPLAALCCYVLMRSDFELLDHSLWYPLGILSVLMTCQLKSE